MPLRMTVQKQGGMNILGIVEHVDNEEDLLLEVYEAVNAAAFYPVSERNTERFKTLYNEGPFLFKAEAIGADTGRSVTRVGGIKVTDSKLADTLEALRQRKVEVDD